MLRVGLSHAAGAIKGSPTQQQQLPRMFPIDLLDNLVSAEGKYSFVKEDIRREEGVLILGRDGLVHVLDKRTEAHCLLRCTSDSQPRCSVTQQNRVELVYLHRFVDIHAADEGAAIQNHRHKARLLQRPRSLTNGPSADP